MKIKLHKQLGATLVEILIAFTILAFGVMTLLEFQNDSFRAASINQQRSQAFVLAERKLNELKHYVELESTPGASDYEEITNGAENVSGNNTSYTISWNVAESTDPDFKVVNVSVTWTDQANQSRSVSLESIVGRVSVVKSGEYMQDI